MTQKLWLDWQDFVMYLVMSLAICHLLHHLVFMSPPQCKVGSYCFLIFLINERK